MGAPDSFVRYRPTCVMRQARREGEGRGGKFSGPRRLGGSAVAQNGVPDRFFLS